MTTRTGRSITVTGHHPLLLPDGWRRADRVEVGETLALPAVMPEPLMPARLPDELVDLAAILAAEGSTTTSMTGFSTTDPEIVRRATAGAAVLGARVKHRSRLEEALAGINYVLVGAPPSGVRTPAGRSVSTVKQFRIDFGLDGTLAKNKALPRPIWSLPTDQVARFVGIFLMCDGHVTATGEVRITLASRQLVRDLQSLLLRLRVQSSVHEVRMTDPRFRAWKLSVHARTARALADVPMWGRRRERLIARLERMTVTSNPNVGAPTLTPALRTELVGLVRPGNPNGGGRPTPAERGSPHRLGHGRQLPAFAGFVEEFGVHERHGWLLSPDLHWDPLVSIEPMGPQQVYDIEVADTHSFVANDIVVHNSSIVSSVGALVAEADWNVLLIDFDPQGNLSEDLGLGEETDDGEHQFDAVPKGAPFHPQPTGRPRLDIVHGGSLLHDLHAVMQARQSRDPDGWSHSLANSIAGVADDYDLILIDCPPGNEVLQTLALVAARYALIPTRSDASSRKGLREVARRFQSVRPRNEHLELLGVVRTGITSSGKAIRDEVRRDIEVDLGGAAPVLQTCIRYAERPAKTVRDTGRLPHELEPELAQQRQQLFAKLRELRKTKTTDKEPRGKHRHDPTTEAEIVLAPSTSGLAQDYAELTQEFLDLLAQAEDAAEATA